MRVKCEVWASSLSASEFVSLPFTTPLNIKTKGEKREKEKKEEKWGSGTGRATWIGTGTAE